MLPVPKVGSAVIAHGCLRVLSDMMVVALRLFADAGWCLMQMLVLILPLVVADRCRAAAVACS